MALDSECTVRKQVGSHLDDTQDDPAAAVGDTGDDEEMRALEAEYDAAAAADEQAAAGLAERAAKERAKVRRPASNPRPHLCMHDDAVRRQLQLHRNVPSHSRVFS